MHFIAPKRQYGIRQISVTPRFGRVLALMFIGTSGAVLTLPTAGSAQELTWDTTSGDAGVVGGSGSWTNSAQTWTSDGGGSNETWTSGGDAVFGGAAGTVTVNGTQSVGDITFNTDGYTVTGGALDLGTGNIDVASGTATIASTIDGDVLTKVGSGALTLSGANSHTGTTTLEAGGLTLSGGAAIANTGAVVVNGGTLTVSNSETIGSLSGYSGGVAIASGHALTTGDDNSTTSYGGVISGAGGLTKSGAGTMTLNGTNTYTGETIVNSGGTLVAGNANAFGAANNFRVSGTADLGGFTITKFSTISQGGTLQNGTLNMTGALQIQNATVDTILSGTGYVASIGGGTSTLSAANTFTGNLVADYGVLDITGSTVTNTVNITDLGSNGAGVIVRGNSLADTADVTISNSGVLTVAADETIGSLASTSATASVVLNADLTTGDASNDVFAGTLSGASDLIYHGSGTFDLSGANTMTGDIQNTSGGALTLSGSTAGGVMNTNGTFNTSGATAGPVTNASGAIFNANAGSTFGDDIDNAGSFNLASSDFALEGVFTNTGTVTNTAGSGVTLAVGTGANFINRGTLDGGVSGITLTGDEFTIGVGSALTAVTLDVDNLTAEVNYDLSGTTDYNFTNSATATVTANANFSGGSLMNTDALDVSGGNLTGVNLLDNGGTVNIGDGTARTVEASSITNSGTINVNDGSTLRGTGNTTNNSGTVNVAGGGALVETTGDYNNLAGGEVNFNDAGAKSFDVQAGVITNAGDLNFNLGVTTVNSAGGAIANSGSISIADTATMDAAGDTINNSGAIDIAANATLTADTLVNDTGGVVNTRGMLVADVTNQGSGDFNVLDNLTSLTSNFTNTDTATLDFNANVSIISDLTNTTTGGTGVTVATGAAVNASAIQNGLSNGSAASVITNNGGLYSDTSIANHAGATVVSNTANSLIAFENTLTNNGTMTMAGRIGGTSVVNSGAGASFDVVGNLNQNNSNPLNAFTNENGAVLSVSGGTFWVDALTNTSSGTGSTSTTAGGQIAADGALVVAGVMTNDGTGTLNNAGTLEATTITNTATLISSGEINGDVDNSGTFEVGGALNGAMTNNGTGTVTTVADVTGITALTQNSSGLISIEDGHSLEAETIQVASGSAGLSVGVGSSLVGTGNTHNNAATIDVAAGGTIMDAGAINNLATGIINFADGGTLAADTDVSGDESITNAGVININGGTTAISMGGAGVFDNQNLLRLASGTGVSVTGAMANTGTINMQNGTATETVSVSGDYAGGGALNIDINFDTDASDTLVVGGDVTGPTTTVSVNDIGSTAVTGNDIVIASVTGTAAADAFELSTPLSFGVLIYDISQSGSDFVLGATGGYIAEVVGLEAFAPSLLFQNSAATLQQRIGDWENGSVRFDRVWASVDGGQTHFTPKTSATGFESTTNLYRLRAGVNFDAGHMETGQLILGVNGAYGTATTNATGTNGTASIDTEHYSIGATATWIATSGFYTDGQLQYTSFDSDILASGSDSSVDGAGYLAALEIGQRFDVAGTGWALTPNGSLHYSAVDFDDFTSGGGVATSLKRARSLRVGLGAKAEFTTQSGNGANTKFFGMFNIYDELDGTITSDVSGSEIKTKLPRWTGEIGLGVSHTFNNGRGNTYANITQNSSLGDTADFKNVAVGLGVQMSF